ncbi:GSCFA domain-containing protein [Hymenobacter humi]|uniref:GSCFA domain-containing protein n=1 Tax=Hymenobacter humi TaxID=1411620 RepID=A0ABW2U4J7_9BACT
MRDYRFYASDMLHPSEVAEEYIWDKFARTYFDVDFGRFRKEWASVRQSLGHRPLHAGAPEHRQFLESTLAKLEQLSLRRVPVTDELSEVSTKLAALPVPMEPEPAVLAEDDEERIDIGEGAASSEAPVMPREGAAAPVAENRLPRLSPEEFRSQRAARSGRPERGRRDGRGKGQPQMPAENEQFQASEAFAGDQDSLTPAEPMALLPTKLGISEELLEQAAAPVSLEPADGNEAPAKKKKRRSRGGAKRTARKNALRLAAGEIEPGSELMPEPGNVAPEPVAAAVTENPDERPESRKSSVITKSVPVKRGRGRNDAGRVPRVPLFAPADDASANDVSNDVAIKVSAQSVDAEVPIVEAAVPLVQAPAVITEAATTLTTAHSKSRNNRNRGRKGAVETPVAEAPRGMITAPESFEVAPLPVMGTAEQLSGVVEPIVSSADNRNRRENLPVPSPIPAEAAADSVANAATSPAPARRSNRAKRVVSGGRSEKPAIDVPVVPISDELRTQVAAGRMTGSSATLIEPTAGPAPATKKPAAAKAATPKQAAAPKKAVAPKAKPAKKAPVPTAAPPAAEVEAPETAVAKPKRKPAAKPKVAAAKPPASKPKPAKKPTKPA